MKQNRFNQKNIARIIAVMIIMVFCMLAFIFPIFAANPASDSWTPPGSNKHTITATISTSASETATKYTVTVSGTAKIDKKNVTGTLKGKLTFDGTSNTTGSHSFTFSSGGANGAWSGALGGAGITKTYDKTANTQTKSASYHVWINGTDTDHIADCTATLNITVPALSKYTVTCKPNGGSGSDWSGSAYAGSTITLPGAITRTGYNFGGWNANSAGTGANYDAGTSKNAESWGNLTLYAKWTEKTATLTYANGGHGTAPSAETMRYTQATTAKAGIDGGEGWAFAGWKNSATGEIIQPGETVKAANTEPVATVLTAQWVKPQYSITYEGMSGAAFGTNHPETGTYDQEIRIDNPSMPGYKFRGWEITGMDSCTHTVGTETTTATSITTKEQYFTNLRGDSGTVTFTALWQSLETGYRVMFAVGEPD